MNHAEHLVDLVDESGIVVGSKQRQEINKAADLYHTVFVILRTPAQELILSKIPDRKDLPNLYPGCIGATVATIRRHDETPDEASLRAVRNELFTKDIQLTRLVDMYLELAAGSKRYMSAYCGTHPMPEDFSHKDIESLVAFDRAELEDAIQSKKDQFALTFLTIWQKCQAELFLV